MNGRLAILCPGQGGQHPAMFDFLGAGEQTGRRLQAWGLEEQLGVPLDAVLGGEGLLYTNRMAQPLIVAATVAAWEAVRPVLPPISLVAGYSVGELAAYAIAGSLAAADAIALSARRAMLMDQCAGTAPGQGLLAISGMPAPRLEARLAGCGLAVAIRTGPDSVIAGGLREALSAAVEALEKQGARASILPVEIASHTPLMQAAVAPFHESLCQSAFAEPVVPVLAGITAEAIQSADRAREALARQLSEPILWQACMRACVERGITAALELGPGAALSRMFRLQCPEIECRSVQDFRSIAGIEKWAARQTGG